MAEETEIVRTRVPNPAMDSLEETRRVVKAHGDQLREHLDKAVRAMDRQAWVSTQADDFSTGLRSAKRDLDRAADDALADVDAEIARTPDTIVRTYREPRAI